MDRRARRSSHVYVCANYRTCTTPPVNEDDVDAWEPPICDEGLPMSTRIHERDWPHRWAS